MTAAIRTLAILWLLTNLLGCSSTRGVGRPFLGEISHLCVRENNRVTVAGFQRDLERQLASRHLEVDLVSRRSHCEHPYLIEYVARRSFGVVTLVELDLYHHGKNIGYVDWGKKRLHVTTVAYRDGVTGSKSKRVIWGQNGN